MSRLAKKPITIPTGVTVTASGGRLAVKGPKGEKELALLPRIAVKIEGDMITVATEGKDKQSRANCGTMWSLTNSAVQGVVQGFTKVLQIEGIGYRAVLEGKTLVLSLGYAHPVKVEPSPKVVVQVEKNMVTISGVDKELVGKTAAEIRALKPPEPYKGKGIRYQGEVIRMKAGKKASTAIAA